MKYLVFTILCIITAALIIKLYLLQKGLKEIDSCLEDILSKDTNGQITLSSRSRHIRFLASRLNSQLKQFREKQLKYNSGDKELKEAVTNISHDLRTPLTAINGYLELLEKEVRILESSSAQAGFCPETQTHLHEMQHYLEVLRNRTGHMRQLTDELFRYSLAMSVPEGFPRQISLNRALEECIISFYDAFLKKGIVPEISMPSIPVIRTLDPAALSRILQNILSNALKYSGGDLEIRLTEDGTVTCANSAPHLNPLLTQQLFDRYFTVETVPSPDSGHSTGLGLSIARLLTERLGGRISAQCRQQAPSPLQSYTTLPPSSPESIPQQAPSGLTQSCTTENRLEITIQFPAP